MKKQLLILCVCFVSYSLFGETVVKMADNTQYGAANSFQAKVASIIPSDYQAKTGDIITVTIEGTADYNLTNFQIVFSDTRPEVNYWKELSGWKAFNDVTASTAFAYSTTATITSDAAGEGGGFCNLVLEAVSTTAISDLASEVTLTLTKFEIAIESSSEEGIITLTDNSSGDYQGDFADTLETSPAVVVNDMVRITIEGTSNTDITDFRAAIVDGTAAASYWKELSAYTLFGTNGTVTKDTPFTLTADISITDIPVGTGFKSQFIVIKGKASETIKLNLTKFTAEILESTPTVLVKNNKLSVLNTTIYTINGVIINNSKPIEQLNDGLYIVSTTYNDGSISTEKILIKN